MQASSGSFVREVLITRDLAPAPGEGYLPSGGANNTDFGDGYTWIEFYFNIETSFSSMDVVVRADGQAGSQYEAKATFFIGNASSVPQTTAETGGITGSLESNLGGQWAKARLLSVPTGSVTTANSIGPQDSIELRFRFYKDNGSSAGVGASGRVYLKKPDAPLTNIFRPARWSTFRTPRSTKRPW